MKEIPLGNSTTAALVDDDDFDRISVFAWLLFPSGYAYRNECGERKTRIILMHREVLACPGMIDHINGNKLDNRRSNLRACNFSQNGANRGRNKNNTSGFKGVVWDKFKRKYRAQIKVMWKSYNLGRFDDPEAAARAYDRAALKYHGEFARLNFPALSPPRALITQA